MKRKAGVMHIRNHRFLLSERSALQKLISRTSPGDTLGRISLERRLQEVERELEAYTEGSPQRPKAYLAFWGALVMGHGIQADFGREAVNFAKVVTAVEASQRATLPNLGQASNRQDYRWLITCTVPGSFVCQVEAIAQPPGQADETAPAENAIEQVKTILAASVGPKKTFKVAIADIDRHALTSIHAFVKSLAEGKTLCALAFRNDEFRFRNTKQVKRSEKRLRPNEPETNAPFTVHWHSPLSGNREAEFEILAVNAPISSEEVGRIAQGQGSLGTADSVDVQAFTAFWEQIVNQAEGLCPFADASDVHPLIAQPVSLDVRTQRTKSGHYAVITRVRQDAYFSSTATT